jgi:hypothetical protein
MTGDFYGYLFGNAQQALPVSLVAWLAIQLLYQAVRQGEGLFFEGVYTFLAVWGLITIVNYNTNGVYSSAITALALSLLGMGALAPLIRAVVWILSPKQRSDKDSG